MNKELESNIEVVLYKMNNLMLELLILYKASGIHSEKLQQLFNSFNEVVDEFCL